jgi:hypothetical protein
LFLCLFLFALAGAAFCLFSLVIFFFSLLCCGVVGVWRWMG